MRRALDAALWSMAVPVFAMALFVVWVDLTEGWMSPAPHTVSLCLKGRKCPGQ